MDSIQRLVGGGAEYCTMEGDIASRPMRVSHKFVSALLVPGRACETQRAFREKALTASSCFVFRPGAADPSSASTLRLWGDNETSTSVNQCTLNRQDIRACYRYDSNAGTHSP